MITIDLDSPEGLTEQVRQGVREALASGRISAGQPLPPVRQLAADLGINFNTVARAYRLLEGEGLVSSVRGRGTVVVAGRSAAPPAPGWRRQWAEQLRQLAVDARLAGLSRGEYESACADAAAVLWRKSA